MKIWNWYISGLEERSPILFGIVGGAVVYFLFAITFIIIGR